MITATTVNTWKDAANAYWAAAVEINGSNVEFIASTPLAGTDDNGNPVTYSDSDLSAALQANMADTVNTQLATIPQTIAGLMGSSVAL